MKISSLQRKHPKYIEDSSYWNLLLGITKGGKRAQKFAGQMLANPNGRSQDVIKEMIKVAPIVNKMGPLINRINSKVFSDKLSIQGTQNSWFQSFRETGGRHDEKRNLSFEQVIRIAASEALATGKSYLQVDTATSIEPENLAQQPDEELRPYLNLLDRASVWDWEAGEGGLTMAKIHSFRTERRDWMSPRQGVHEFLIYVQEGARVLVSKYEVRLRNYPKGMEDRPFIERLTDKKAGEYIIRIATLASGTEIEQLPIFNLGGRFEFPIIELAIPEEFCLGDQLYGLQREHYNNRVGAQWRLQRSNFSMPYAKGGDSDPFASKKMGDGFYLWLPDEDIDFGEITVSSDGASLALQMEDVIEKDLYEFVQQLSYAAQQKAAALSRSEGSRGMDDEPENALLAEIGLPILKAVRQCLKAAAIAANDPFPSEQWEIKGLQNFRLKELGGYMPLFKDMALIPVPTASFQRRRLRDFLVKYAATFDLDSESLEQLIADVENLSDEKVMELVQTNQGNPALSPAGPQ